MDQVDIIVCARVAFRGRGMASTKDAAGEIVHLIICLDIGAFYLSRTHHITNTSTAHMYESLILQNDVCA